MLDISQVQFAKPAQPKPLSKKALKKKARREEHERRRAAKLEARAQKADRLEQLTDTENLAEIRMECDVYGLVLRIGYTENHGRNRAPRHWMFETQKGTRVLNWWPTSGKTWSPVNFEKRVIQDVWQVIQYAAQIKEAIG